MNTYFRSEVVSVGTDAVELITGRVAIFFSEPCPDELAEVSIVHRMIEADPQRTPQPGDVLRVGTSEVTITAVGALAGENLRTLGHMVIYCNPDTDQSLLPGAIQARGQLDLPRAGASIELLSGA